MNWKCIRRNQISSGNMRVMRIKHKIQFAIYHYRSSCPFGDSVSLSLSLESVYRVEDEQWASLPSLFDCYFNSQSFNKGKLKRNIQVKLDSVLMNGRWEKYALFHGQLQRIFFSLCIFMFFQWFANKINTMYA